MCLYLAVKLGGCAEMQSRNRRSAPIFEEPMQSSDAKEFDSCSRATSVASTAKDVTKQDSGPSLDNFD